MKDLSESSSTKWVSSRISASRVARKPVTAATIPVVSRQLAFRI
jgi:hypothetical protein